MSRIFISYRRSDVAASAGRIYDCLESRFGKDAIFMDVDALRAGEDFRERIQEAVEQCQVLLVVIGHGWIQAKDESGRRRLDNPADWVRLEVETALERHVTVIPVLSEGVLMPRESELPESLRPLAYRQAAFVRHGRDFKVDMSRLSEVIQQQLVIAEQQAKIAEERKRLEEEKMRWERKRAEALRRAEVQEQAKERVATARKVEAEKQIKLNQINRQKKALQREETEKLIGKQKVTTRMAEGERSVGMVADQTNRTKTLSRKQLLAAAPALLITLFVFLFTAAFVFDFDQSASDNSEQVKRTRKEDSLEAVYLSSLDRSVVSDAPIHVKGAAVQEAWVSIIADDDVTVFEGVLQPGDVQVWEAQEILSVYTGDAGALALSANGKEFEMMGEPGQPDEAVFSNDE